MPLVNLCNFNCLYYAKKYLKTVLTNTAGIISSECYYRWEIEVLMSPDVQLTPSYHSAKKGATVGWDCTVRHIGQHTLSNIVHSSVQTELLLEPTKS